MPRRLRRWLSFPAAVYALVVIGLYLGQRSLLYPRPAPMELPVTGARLTAVFPGGETPIWLTDTGTEPVVWFHGNGEQLASTRSIAEAFTARNFHFAAIEYPGYGLSTGVGPTEETILAAATASLDVLVGAGFTAPTCVAHSLGTGVAAAMAESGRCERLVLVAPYTSLPAAAAWQYPWVPARWLLWDQLDTLGRASRIHVPTLVVHGARDGVIPVEMGRMVGSAVPGARYIEREGRGHGSVLDTVTFDAIAAFVRGEAGG